MVSGGASMGFTQGSSRGRMGFIPGALEVQPGKEGRGGERANGDLKANALVWDKKPCLGLDLRQDQRH